MSDLVARDRAVAWHPYTQHGLEDPPLPVAAASGATLTLEDGETLLDAISSWWACLHGHGHPRIVEAIARQAATLDHVLFAGATHEPAVRLAERLLEIAPAGLSRVFFSDNGSTAVEVALKMVLQSWAQEGAPERRVFVALDGSYHGDTFGAMAVGDPDPFFERFRPFLFEARRAAPDGAAIEEALAALGARAAGVILEPLVQGAAGMRMHPAEVVAAARAACDRHGVPLIADEVMTGFGRTGARFACEAADVRPDLVCLSKGLTGGAMPLAVTLATEARFDAFRSDDRGRMLFHGHTFTAHPIGCAAALASLELTIEDDVPARLDAIGRTIHGALAGWAAGRDDVRELRRTGGIVAFDVAPPGAERGGYLSSLARAMRAIAVKRGVLLRPLGNVLYAMPPACVTDDEALAIAAAMRACVEELPAA